MITRARLLATATLLALAGCNAAPSGEPAGNAAAPDTAAVEQDQASPPPAPDAASTTPVANQPEFDAVPPVAPLPAGPVPAGSCAAEIGAEAATRLATECRAVSPATRPPCNPANSCELIRAEIERGCAMLDEADRPAACAAPADD